MKNKSYQCNCCKTITTDPYSAKIKEFYYSKENKPFINIFIPRKIVKKITLCGNCYQKISDSSVVDSYMN